LKGLLVFIQLGHSRTVDYVKRLMYLALDLWNVFFLCSAGA
jgi:hypothetical protein